MEMAAVMHARMEVGALEVAKVHAGMEVRAEIPGRRAFFEGH
jgi:hypothetical protein